MQYPPDKLLQLSHDLRGDDLSPPGLPTYMMKCFTKLTYTMAAMSRTWSSAWVSRKAPPSMAWTGFPLPR